LLSRIKKYFSYYFRADTVHNVHSPFVYDFIFDVLDTKKDYYAFNAIEHERRILMSNKNNINIEDFGAGSKTGAAKKRAIASLAKNVVSNKKKCSILFNLINKYAPHTSIELGTSLGISTMYMARAMAQNTIYTIEADPNVYKLAHILFERNHIPNIVAINGTFENILPTLLEKIDILDLAYVDGNHSYEATIKHFKLLKAKCHQGSIMVFDDIYWSDGMSKAWQEIKKNKDVVYTIDIFDMGFVFFDKKIGDKKDFTLIDFWKKPYRLGFLG
jgi:predicted O-methyltransferase YrrM